ncbi:hypothetical protein IAR55_004232 [Kwoniella newhampshirensis]|uniref:Uncharacterized protein n=1 Tax=Kwoniella newhampshirensis TaxID=1651941 RepID=A0AAW0YWT7_9TREE
MALSRYLANRRVLLFILVITVLAVYNTTSLTTHAQVDWARYLVRDTAWPGNIRLTHADLDGTFLETRSFDLPNLIRDKRAEHDGELQGLKIAVLEHAGFHEEVVGAVIKTLVDIGADFTLYRDNFRWGYFDVLQAGMNYTTWPTPFSDGTYAAAVAAHEIDITIHISCDHAFWNWPRNKPAYEAMKANTDMEVVCMLHELENLSDDERRSWEKAAAEDRLTYLTLSKHVKRYLQHEVLKWADRLRDVRWGKVQVEEFVPLFPIDPSALPDSEIVKVAEYFPKRPEHIPSRLAILGNIQTWRRNYNPIIKDLHDAMQVDPAAWGYLPLSSEPNATYVSANDAARPPVTAHFIGSLAPTSKLEIPDSMRDMVYIHSGLSYSDFYRLLGSMDLVLPAFIGWTYLEKKLSSAIPAGVVSRVPILGSELLLNAYEFLRVPALQVEAAGLREIESVRLLREGIDPYASQFTSSPPRLLLPGMAGSQWLGELENYAEDAVDGKMTRGNTVTNHAGTKKEWDEYHERLYEGNAEMMTAMFGRLGKRIRARKGPRRKQILP